jgi:hypothetical protein
LGSVVNPDTGVPVYVGENRLLTVDFRKTRVGEIIGVASEREEYAGLKPRRPIYSALWQADGTRIRRVAPLEFIGRYEPATFCTIRYVSEKPTCEDIDSAFTGTFDGRSLRTSPTTPSPATMHSTLNRDVPSWRA